MRGTWKTIAGAIFLIIFVLSVLLGYMNVLGIALGVTGGGLIVYGLIEAMSSEKRWECRRCLFTAWSEKELVQHTLDIHYENLRPDEIETLQKFLEGTPHRCDFCGLFFTTKRKLAQHKLSQHSTEMAMDQKAEARKIIAESSNQS